MGSFSPYILLSIEEQDEIGVYTFICAISIPPLILSFFIPFETNQRELDIMLPISLEK